MYTHEGNIYLSLEREEVKNVTVDFWFHHCTFSLYKHLTVVFGHLMVLLTHMTTQESVTS